MNMATATKVNTPTPAAVNAAFTGFGKKYGGYFCGLCERWQDEKQYEDFNEYIAVVKKVFVTAPKGMKFVSLTKPGRRLEIRFEFNVPGFQAVYVYEVSVKNVGVWRVVR